MGKKHRIFILKAWITVIALAALTLFVCSAACADYNYNDLWNVAVNTDYPGVAFIVYIGESSAVTVPSRIRYYDDDLPVYSVMLGNRSISSVSFIVDAEGKTNVRKLSGPYYESSVTSLTIPEGVVEVEGFSKCRSLRTVSLPSTVTTIGGSAFSQCAQLSTINLENVRYIGGEAFFRAALTQVDLNSIRSIGTNAFTGNAIEHLILPEGLTAVPSQGFWECHNLKDVVISDTVQSIGAWAFRDCELLETVTFGSSITTIGDSAFDGCVSMEEAILPDTVTSIGSFAFRNCSSMTEIHLSASLSLLEANALTGCSDLTELVLPASLTSLGSTNHASLQIKKLVLEDGIGIDRVPFTRLDEMEELYAPVNVTRIYSSDYPKLKKAVVSRFSMVKGADETLEEITLLDNTQTDIKLSNYTALRKVTLPEGLAVLPASAFKGCTALAEINLPESLTSIGTYAFSHCPIAQVVIPQGVTRLYYAFEYNTALETVSIPSAVADLEGAFLGCTALEYAVLPMDSAATSLNCTFQDCVSLRRIEIPASFTNWYKAFSGCISLEEVYFPESGGDPVTNAQYAFENCSSLTGFWMEEGRYTSVFYRMFARSGLEAIEIPQGVTTILSAAFQGCPNLYAVYLPDGLTDIKELSFADCPMLGELDVPDSVAGFSGSAVQNDWIWLTTRQGTYAWSAAYNNPDDGIHARFRDQMEVAEGAYVDLWADDNSHMTLYAPQIVPEGEYNYYFLLEAADGSYSQWQTGRNKFSADFSGLDLDHKIYTGYVFAGYDFRSIDTENRCVIEDCNGVYAGDILWEPDINTAVNPDGEIWFISGLAFVDYLPQDLTTVENEAFDGTALNRRFIVCWPGVESIGNRAFADSGIQAIYLPESVNSVGTGAFDGCNVTIYCVAGSWAESWANSRGLPCHAMEKDE